MLSRVVQIASFVTMTAGVALAQPAPTSVRVASQTIPPGGGGQIQVLLTSPRPVMTGRLMMSFPLGGYSSINGVSLFSPTGDVSGAAVVQGNVISALFTSPQGTFGTTSDYPLMTIAYSVPQTVVPGMQFPLSLNAGSLLADLFGPAALEFQPGTLTVGGSLSVTNVVPGGGTLPAGTVISLQGTGFNPKTKVVLRELKADVQFVSETEIHLRLRQTAAMDGQMIIVQNPDHSSVTYFSYLRGVPMGQSNVPLFAATVPLFSTRTLARALIVPSNMPLVSSDYQTGIAMQNPNLTPVDITIEQKGSGGGSMAKAQLTIPAGARIVREASELLGTSLQSANYLSITSSAPIQILGLLGQTSVSVVQAIDPLPAQ